MGAPCERCKWHDEQDYRDLDDREKHFLMFLMGDFQHEMIVPEEFVQRLKGEIRGEIKLETRNGYSYTVGVSKNQEKVVFMAGWGQFVENFDLQMGESIIFRYNGSSQFSVVMFDKLGREKALSVIADALPPRIQERHTDATETVHNKGKNMGAPCGRCKWRDELDYRGLDDREKHFLMFMMGDFQHEMIVPQEFVQRLKGEIRGEIKLETRNGYSYTIGVSKDQEELVFMAGWGKFVENFDLQMGESIIFRYNGSSQFSVTIFDKLGREKALSVIEDALPPHVLERHTDATENVSRSHGYPQAMQMQLPNDAMNRFCVHCQPMQMQPHAETMDRSHGRHKTKKMQSLTETVTQSQVHPQPMQMQPSSKTVNRSPMQMPPMKRQRRLQRNKSNQGNKTALKSSSSESSGTGDSFSSEEGHAAVPCYNYAVEKKDKMHRVQKEQLKDGYIATRVTKLTPIQAEQVKKEVQCLHSDIPIFVAVMSRVNVVSGFRLTVPNWYGQKYLGDEQSVWLQRLGENWPVNLRGRSPGLLIDRRFENGWQKFVEENDIKIGDICLFERLNNQRCTLKVHIISAKDGSCC
ncbi:putative B3 domain-containing protein Os08g0325100 [Brachypodium distachyon]|uniref:TF-B3 domain-containing protein n=1 Tax=Brachypodium distachyon TaxID=15368 RepID=A0A0Q3J8H0_BRADI|nr:putative B3 domain-containing protein Os08g0325100 [Brachypodium distachyon]KQK14139.2 hypothetical protein BRADI_1g14500v3 [Brachypodium distachyon]|eukprot:XP_014750916.1 putative B3 domain-containing protein Os08g0325100 [Brachypodium distachyon]